MFIPSHPVAGDNGRPINRCNSDTRRHRRRGADLAYLRDINPALKRAVKLSEWDYTMAATRSANSNLLEDPTPTPRDVQFMAEVLEGRHGAFAAEVAEFFSAYHTEKGDAGRAWAWSGVADIVRTRERVRLEGR